MTDPLTAVLGTTFSALHQWVLARVVDGALERRNQRLGDVDRQIAAAVEDLAALRRVEFPTLTDAEWDLTREAAAQTLSASSIGRLAQLAPGDVTDAAKLGSALSATSVVGMSPAEAEAYHRLLFETCEQIAQHA